MGTLKRGLEPTYKLSTNDNFYTYPYMIWVLSFMRKNSLHQFFVSILSNMFMYDERYDSFKHDFNGLPIVLI